MARATPGSLTAPEQALLAETARDALRALDEDELANLLARVRRARDKFVQQHRREVAAQVPAKGGRGAAQLAPRRSASKAELFEDALARTSSALAAAARRSAKALRDERLAAARAASPAAPSAATAPAQKAAPAKEKAPRKPRVSKAQQASSKAAGARRQAKRDATR
ncbi:MAG: hypothetical protein QM733_03485 [Ilumatobacteraceae bacterium]